MRALTWAGAALFAGSLSYFAYFYLVRLGQPGDDPEAGALRAVSVNVLLFTVFALHHSLLARSGAKAWVSRHINPAMERSTYVWIASLLFLAVCLGWQMIPGTAWQTTGAARLLCYGIQIAGLALTLRSASRIDIWDLAGVRPARPLDSGLCGLCVGNQRPLSVGAAPDLPGMGAPGLRHADDDDGTPALRGHQYAVPGGGDSARRTLAQAGVRAGVQPLPAAGAVAARSRRLVSARRGLLATLAILSTAG
jgi:hypothetical protein